MNETIGMPSSEITSAEKFSKRYIAWRFYFIVARHHPIIKMILQLIEDNESSIDLFCNHVAGLYSSLSDVVRGHVFLHCKSEQILKSMDAHRMGSTTIDCMAILLNAYQNATLFT